MTALQKLHNGRRRPGRPAMTLVEILVVIAIIGLLAALMSAAVMKMLAQPPQKNTELLIQKLTASVEQQWKAVSDQARSEAIDANVWNTALAQAGGERQAALDTYIQWRLQQEFPMTFSLAVTPAAGLPPVSLYQLTLGGAKAPGLTPSGNSFESGICLLKALSVSRRGMEFNTSNLSPKEVKDVGSGLQCLMDYWGEPLQFKTGVDPVTGQMTFKIWSTHLNPPPAFMSAVTVVDGSFASVNVGAAGNYYSFSYGTAGTPWTFNSQAGVTANGSGFTSGNPNAPSAQAAFLQNGGTMSQSVNFATAGTYSVDFLAAQRGNYGGVQSFSVSVDGKVVGTFTPGAGATNYSAYNTNTFNVAAGAHTVTFAGLNTSGDNTAFIDNISIKAAQ